MGSATWRLAARSGPTNLQTMPPTVGSLGSSRQMPARFGGSSRAGPPQKAPSSGSRLTQSVFVRDSTIIGATRSRHFW